MTKTHQATIAGAAVLAAALIGGCAGRPAPTPAPSQPYPPPACDRTAIEHADELKLPATRPDDQQAFARRLAVYRKLSRLGRWQQAQGWSTLVVQMHSAGATSLSAHLAGLQLPPRTEVWWCSGDGRERHGPYREAAGGELWTPVIRDERAMLQIWLPSAAVRDLEGVLADVQGGLQ
ncbi:MAG: hypothetical protein VYC42_17400 [Pseudomonadota bacterium]|nr:hypothetical protein [Pseudomonadota bacterium]